MIDRELNELFNRQLNEELRNAYLYLSMAAFFDEKGLGGFANFFKVQAKEELEHAMKFYEHIVDRGGSVELYELPRPKSSWASVLEAAEDFYKAEVENTQRIWSLVEEARKAGDKAAEAFLHWFINEQVEEEKIFQEILQILEYSGETPQAVLMLNAKLAERKS
jgi:ferritin